VKTHRSAHDVLSSVEQVLQSKPRLVPRGRRPLPEIRGAELPVSPLEQVAQLLHGGRRYFAVTIFIQSDVKLVRVASAGPAPRCQSMRVGEGNVGYAAKTGRMKVIADVARDKQYVKVFPETRSEMVTPIKIGAHVIGVLDVESNRLNAFSYQDQVMAREVAKVLARYLAGPGKYVVMKTKESAMPRKAAPANLPSSPGKANSHEPASRELVHAARG
jgi:putative methionine-R-sulfoxide reductase with GAF domain